MDIKISYTIVGILFQIIFNSWLVPHVFYAGIVTPGPKKRKDKNKCSSYRPINVSPVLSKLLELLVIDEITRVCSIPNNNHNLFITHFTKPEVNWSKIQKKKQQK